MTSGYGPSDPSSGASTTAAYWPLIGAEPGGAGYQMLVLRARICWGSTSDGLVNVMLRTPGANGPFRRVSKHVLAVQSMTSRQCVSSSHADATAPRLSTQAPSFFALQVM